MHTNYLQPREGRHSPKAIIDEAKECGFDAIAITEHYIPASPFKMFRQDPLKTYRDFKDYAKKAGILLIPGFEVSLEKWKDVVVLNYAGDVFHIKTFNDLREIKKKHKGVLIFAPHPFFLQKNCLGKKTLIKEIGLFDAIEYCHFYSTLINRNKPAELIAKKYNKPLIGTSDTHKLYQFNHTYTLVDSKKDVNSIISAVKEGKIVLKTEPLSLKLFLYIMFMSIIMGARKVLLLTLAKIFSPQMFEP